MTLKNDRLTGISYEESAARVNSITISGWLLDDVTPDETDAGSKYLKTRLHIRQGSPYFLVKMWLNSGVIEDNVVEALTKCKGDAVVVTGQFQSWVFFGRTYISIDAVSIV